MMVASSAATWAMQYLVAFWLARLVETDIIRVPVIQAVITLVAATILAATITLVAVAIL